ncbi:hypothetical protein [Aequorivita sinensis]|uniref:hypothetical protein n=1 Tax=Aequorivita sinensis TaxID=1382458 RepID=UPI0022FFD9F6|nr:hypothetical protein [Aequorivita sinensis]
MEIRDLGMDNFPVTMNNVKKLISRIYAMAWSVLTWKILRIFQSQFLFIEVRTKTRHSSYT